MKIIKITFSRIRKSQKSKIRDLNYAMSDWFEKFICLHMAQRGSYGFTKGSWNKLERLKE